MPIVFSPKGLKNGSLIQTKGYMNLYLMFINGVNGARIEQVNRSMNAARVDQANVMVRYMGALVTSLFSAACLVTTCTACSYRYVNVYRFQAHRQFQLILSCISKIRWDFFLALRKNCSNRIRISCYHSSRRRQTLRDVISIRLGCV